MIHALLFSLVGLPVKILRPEVRLNHRAAVRIVAFLFPAARAPGRGNFAGCGKAPVVVIPDGMVNLPAYLAFAMAIEMLYAVVIVFGFFVHRLSSLLFFRPILRQAGLLDKVAAVIRAVVGTAYLAAYLAA